MTTLSGSHVIAGAAVAVSSLGSALHGDRHDGGWRWGAPLGRVAWSHTLVCLRPSGAPPTSRPPLPSGPGGRWGSVVFGWRALRPPRVVFIIGCVSCNKFSHFRQKRRAGARRRSRARARGAGGAQRAGECARAARLRSTRRQTRRRCCRSPPWPPPWRSAALPCRRWISPRGTRNIPKQKQKGHFPIPLYWSSVGRASLTFSPPPPPPPP